MIFRIVDFSLFSTAFFTPALAIELDIGADLGRVEADASASVGHGELAEIDASQPELRLSMKRAEFLKKVN